MELSKRPIFSLALLVFPEKAIELLKQLNVWLAATQAAIPDTLNPDFDSANKGKSENENDEQGDSSQAQTHW